MNTDHADAIDAYARGLAGRDEVDWSMDACDPDGIDLRCGNALIRIAFPSLATTPTDMRQVLVAMAKTARSASP
jgi:putative heme iron utilization protein